jgi:hypothetical protein
VSEGRGRPATGSEEGAGAADDVYADGLTGDGPCLSAGVLIKAQSRYGAGTVDGKPVHG